MDSLVQFLIHESDFLLGNRATFLQVFCEWQLRPVLWIVCFTQNCESQLPSSFLFPFSLLLTSSPDLTLIIDDFFPLQFPAAWQTFSGMEYTQL